MNRHVQISNSLTKSPLIEDINTIQENMYLTRTKRSTLKNQ